MHRVIRSLACGGTVLACAVSLVAMPSASADTVSSPAAPVLVSPTDTRNTDTPVVKDLVLTWTKVTGAVGYQVQMSPNEVWTNNKVELPNEGKTVATVYEVPVSLPHASYFWRVRALLSGGSTTVWSADRVLTRDWNDRPTTVSSPTAGDRRFVWTAVRSASVYELQVSEDPSFSANVLLCDTNHTTFAPYKWKMESQEPGVVVTTPDCFKREELVNGTLYYWHVIALDGTLQVPVPADSAPPTDSGYGCQQKPECSRASDVRAFTYTAPATSSIVPATPAGLAAEYCPAGVCFDTPSLTWTPVANAAYYEVRVAVDPFHSNIQRVYTTTGAGMSPRDSFFDDQGGRAYYWYVRGCNSDDKCGSFSSDATFTKASRPVRLSSPANGAMLTTSQVTFSWEDFQLTNITADPTSVQEAMDYRLQLSSDANFENNLKTFKDIDLTQFTNPAALLGDGTYFWRVQANDASEILEPDHHDLTWSATRSFTVDSKKPTLALHGTMSGRSSVTLVASEAVNGVTASTLGVRTVSSSTAIKGLLTQESSTQWRFTPTSPWVAGEHYKAWASAAVQDGVGNGLSSTGATLRASTLVDSSSSAMAKKTGDASWHTSTASDARGKSFIYSSDKASTAARSSVSTYVAGTHVYLDGCVSPSSGIAAVYVDGVRSATLNFHRKSSSCHQVWASPKLADKQHKVTVLLLGSKVKKSKGTTVSVDAIRVS